MLSLKIYFGYLHTYNNIKLLQFTACNKTLGSLQTNCKLVSFHCNKRICLPAKPTNWQQSISRKTFGTSLLENIDGTDKSWEANTKFFKLVVRRDPFTFFLSLHKQDGHFLRRFVLDLYKFRFQDVIYRVTCLLAMSIGNRCSSPEVLECRSLLIASGAYSQVIHVLISQTVATVRNQFTVWICIFR